MSYRVSVIITAAGSSSRMGGAKKEFFSLGCGTVLSETAKKFLQTIDVSQMVVTYAKASASVDVSANSEASADADVSAYAARAAFFADSEMETLASKTKLMFVLGGATRQASVHNAMEALAEASANTWASASAEVSAEAGESHIVLVHDGARPFVTSDVIRAVVDAAKKYGAAVPAVEPVDTLKEKDANGFITRHLTRAQLAAVQTPQGFRFAELLEGHRKAAGDGKTYTDDSEIWGAYCGEVKIVTGDISNKKITYASDLPRASHSENNAHSEEATASESPAPHFRTGFGYDLHRLVSGRKLVIGGVTIPFEKGEDGHSDGDVLLHAITDALLGAAALGDIGSFFPPNDATWKDADSVRLMQIAWEKVKSAGWILGNLDCVVKLEKPKLLPFREEICASIANALGVTADKVFVKAKTSEKLGDVGHGDAIEAWASCIIH